MIKWNKLDSTKKFHFFTLFFFFDNAQTEADMIQADNKPKDALQVPEGPITRQRTKRLRESMAGLVQSFMADCNKQIEMHVGFDGNGPKPFHLAQISLE